MNHFLKTSTELSAIVYSAWKWNKSNND